MPRCEQPARAPEPFICPECGEVYVLDFDLDRPWLGWLCDCVGFEPVDRDPAD